MKFKLRSCTGYVDRTGLLVHDGDTCPVHEQEPVWYTVATFLMMVVALASIIVVAVVCS